MRSPTLSPELQKRLEEIAEELGPLPHGELDLNGNPVVAVSPIPLNRPKKQTTRQLKATCPECVSAGGDYKCRIAGSYVKDPGPPLCPKHKCALLVEWPLQTEHTDEEQQSIEDVEGDAVEPGMEANDLGLEPFTRTRSEDGPEAGIAA